MSRRGFVVSLRAVLVGLLVCSAVLHGPIAQAAVDAVTVTATPNPVVPASTVDLRAGIPVANASGLASQEIVQLIDPTKIKLRSRYDITAPAGWTLSYSRDGVNFTTPEPTTEAGWALIKGVKAQGQVETQGSVDGRQVTSKTAVDNTAPTGVFVGAAASGDGWDVIFDDRGHVFNVFHHDGDGGVGNGAIDCHMRSGANCPGTWPYPLTANNMHTPQNSSGWYDPTTRRIWLNINTNSQAGFVCLDLSDMTAANKWCGGSATTAFVGLEAITLQAGYAYNGNCSQEPYHYTCINAMVESGGRLFAWNGRTNHLLCLNTRAPGSGAACSGQPVVFPGVTEANWGHHPLVEWQGRIYGTPGWGQAGALCVVAATLGACPGWTGAAANLRSFSPLPRADRLTLLPNAQGTIVGVCYLHITGILTSIGSPYAMTCYNAAGATITPPAAFVTAFGAGQRGNRMLDANATQVSGSRVYWGNAGWDLNGKIFCWDVALNAGAGGYCANWGDSAGKTDLNYTAVLDPVNNNCLWTNDDGGEIKTWDTVTATVGCTTMSTTVNFRTDALVPRMGCDSSTAIGGWRQFKLNGPAVYTGAKLTVTTEAGAPIAGWTNVSIPGSASAGTAIVDLTTLDPSVSGQNPNFSVSFATRGGNDAASATITAVGDAPQLCLVPTAVLTCPTAIGPIDDSEVLGSTTTATGSGASTLTGGSRIDMTADVETIAVTSTPKAMCGSILTGVATEYGASTAPIPGVVATLINSATGLPVRDAGNNPVTVTTGVDGSYSFGYLAPGSYKVSFASPSSGTGYVARTATTVSGAAGTTAGATNATGSGSAAVALSNTVALAVGTDGVVNGDYVIPVLAAPDTSTGKQGALQTTSVTANDRLSTGGSSPSIKLCLAGQIPNGCTGASTSSYFDVAGQGRYAYVNGTTLSFQPCTAAGNPIASCTGPFTGTASPATYQVTDSSGTTSSSTYTPTVVPPPTAVADAQTGPLDTNQSYFPLSNDIAGSGSSLVTGNTRLCLTTEIPNNCTATTVTVSGQGTYTLNTSTGQVVFDPLPTFTGAATPVKYIVKDSLGQTTSSSITPTVTPPPPVVPAPDTTSGAQGVVQSVMPLLNDDTVTSAVSLTTSSLRLCGANQVVPNCTQTFRVVPGQGVYVDDTTTGTIRFVPCNTTAGPLTYGGVTYSASCTGTPFTGTATPVTYQATDNLNRTINSTYTPTVYGVPVASTDVSSGAFNTPQTITPLANDTAGAATTLTPATVRLCAVSPAKNPPNCDDTTVFVAGQGTYTVNASGVVTFTPVATFYGTATPLKYQVSDSAGQVANSTITPSVTSPPAVSMNANATTGGQGAVQSSNLLANDVAPAGVTLVASSVRLCGPPSPFTCDDTTVTIGGVGTYTVDSSGVVTFTPEPGYTGTPTALGYQVTDSVGRTATSTYTPTVVPRPNAVDDTSTGPYGQAQTIPVLADDTAGSGTSLVASSVRLCGPGDDSTAQGAGGCDDTTLTTASGTYTVNVNGSVSFTPAPGFSGTAPPVAYQVTDGLGQKDAASLTVTVVAPVSPTAGDDTVVVRPGASETFTSIIGAGGLTTPGDGALAPMSTCLVDPLATPPACDSDDTVTIAGVGTWRLDRTTGVVTFTADPAAAGSSGSVDFRVTDVNGQTAVGTLTAVIPPPPTARDDTSYGEQGQPQVLLPTGNDTSGEAATSMSPASVRLCDAGQSAPNCTATSVFVAGQGTFTVNPATGAVTFTPVATFYGTVTPVAYQVADTTGQTASAWLRPVVLPKPAPNAIDDTGYAPYGQSVTLTPLANDDSGNPPADDTSISNLTLNASSLTLCTAGQSPDGCSATSVTTVDGTYTLVGSTVTFAPASGFSGTVTAPVQYQVSNSYTQAGLAKAQTGSAYLVPSVGAPAPPVARDDSAIGLVNTSVSVSPLADDSAGQQFALVPGSLRLCGTGETAPNCTASTVSVAGQGTFALNPATGVVTFTPLPGWTGTASVPYVVADAGGQVVDAEITVTVNAPAASDDTSYGRPGVAQAISVLSNDAAAAGTGTSLIASTLRLCGPGQSGAACDQTSVTTTKGTYTVNTGTGVVTFTPAPGFMSGDDSVIYVVADSAGQLASAEIRPSVVSPPLPVATDDRAYGPVGGSVTFQPWVNDASMGDRTQGTVSYDDSGLTRASVRLCGPGDVAGACDDTTLTTADGTYVVNTGTGAVTFTPVAGFTGTAAFPVIYEITNPYAWTDSSGSGSGTQVVAATLTPVIVSPPSPSAVDDTAFAGYGQPVSFSPWTNDSAMGDSTTGTVSYGDSGLAHASVRLCGTGDVVPNCDDTTITTADGTYAVDLGTGVVTFTPAPGFTGPATPVRYQVDNLYVTTNSGVPAGTGTQTSSALLWPSIGPFTPPNADSDAGSGYVDDTVAVDLVANDDSGTYPLVPASVLLCDDTDVAPACTHTTVVLPGQGTFTVDASGSVTFAPDAGWAGQVQVPYSIADTSGDRAASVVTVTIIAPVPPTATDDTATTPAGTPVTLDAGTDDDTGTYPLDMSSVRLCGSADTAPACTQSTVTNVTGTFTVNPDGTVIYTPAPGFSGSATVIYSVADARGVRDDALLTVIVAAPPPPGGAGGGGGGGGVTPPPPPPPPGPGPVTEPDRGVAPPGEPVRIDPIGNDTPGQGQEFDEGSLRLCPVGSAPPDCTGLAVETPQGTWVVDPFTGAVVFTPEDGFVGKVEIPYVIDTDDGDQVDSVITIWITDPPDATDDASSGRVDTPQRLAPIDNDVHDAAPWVASTLRLCGEGQAPDDCDATRVETSDGVYEVDPVTGQVVFTPAPGFTGAATPVRYQVADEAGQVADAWLRPTVRGSDGGGEAQSGWLDVRKVITKGADLRTGAVKLVTTCTDRGGQTMKRTHVMDTGIDRKSWRVKVPAGMSCNVHERSIGAPQTPGIAPTWDERRWQVGHSPSIDVGEKVPVGTAVPIDELILSAKGGCQVIAGELVGVAVGTCTVSWRVPDGSVTTRTKWTHTTARATRTGEGTLTRAIPIAGGATTRVTFTNAYDARAHVVTRTVYITDPCAPIPKARPRYAGTDPVPNPGTCT